MESTSDRFCRSAGFDNQPDERFAQLVDLPPSAKLVFFVLEEKGPCTQTDLAEEALLPKRTIRAALTTLKEADLVTEDVYIPDARKKLYQACSIEHGNDEK